MQAITQGKVWMSADPTPGPHTEKFGVGQITALQEDLEIGLFSG
jgi:hypothetical protein